jgi:hypothetical protein
LLLLPLPLIEFRLPFPLPLATSTTSFLERQYHPTGLLSVGRESAIYVVDKGETFLIGES